LKLDSKTILIVILTAVSIGSTAFALTTYYGSGSFTVHVEPAPGINSTTITVSPALGTVLASAGGNFSEAVCFTNAASTPITVFFNYSVSPPPGGSFTDIQWEIPSAITVSGHQDSCSAAYPVIVSSTAVAGDYNVSVTYSWTG
jgi:hypothetical protein